MVSMINYSSIDWVWYLPDILVYHGRVLETDVWCLLQLVHMVKFSVNARVTDVTTHIVSLWLGLITWKRGIVIAIVCEEVHTPPSSSCICNKIGLGRQSLKPNSAFCNSNTAICFTLTSGMLWTVCNSKTRGVQVHKCKSAQVFLWHRNSLEHARRNVFRAQHRLKHRCLKWEQLSSLGLLALKMCFSYSTAQHK